MKNVKRIFVITFMLAFILSISSINAFAATVTQDNLEVTLVTDKEKYSENEQIKTTLTVKNNNDTAVTNVDLETALPDGYKLAAKSENKKTVDSIAAGESVSLDVTLEKDNTKKESTPSEPSTDAKSSTNPVSGGNSSNSGNSGTTTGGTTTSGSTVQTGQGFWIVGILILVLLVSVVTFTFVYRKTNKGFGKKLLSLFICFGIATSSVIVSIKTNAVEQEVGEVGNNNISLQTNVKINEKDYLITANVKYDAFVYSVEFVSNGGDEVPSQKILKGKTVAQPNDPQRTNYIFVGWYLDSELKVPFDFSTPVTYDLILYAKWASDSFYLYSEKEVFLLVNGSQSVTMYLDTPLATDSISLNYGTGEELSNNVLMYDNGTGADDIAGDGIYSASITIMATEDTRVLFEANYDNKKSNQVSVCFYSPITAETYDAIETVGETLESFKQTENYKEMTSSQKVNAIVSLLNGFEQDNKVIEGSVNVNEDECLVSFMYPEGILGGFSYKEFDLDMNGSFDSNLRNNDSFSIQSFSEDDFSVGSGDSDTIGKAVILNSFPTFETEPEVIEYRTTFYNNLQTKWNNNGLETTLITNPTVNDYKHLDEYNVDCISTHGSVYSWRDGFLWLNYHEYPSICLAETSNSAKNKTYELELKDKQIAVVNNRYRILPSFIEKNYSATALSDTFVFSECCEALGKNHGNNSSEYDYSMANAFTGRSAKTFIGFHNSVFADYSREMMEEYVDCLIDGNTSQQAYDSAINKLGANHRIWYETTHSLTLQHYYETKEHPETYQPSLHVAYPVHRGNGDAMLINNGIQNGGFEQYETGSTSPQSWKCVGDVRTVKQLGSVKPISAASERMAIVTSGIGAKSTAVFAEGTEGSKLSQTFRVPASASKIVFSYNFVSEEPLEYVGSKYDDSFVVQLTKGNATKYNHMYESINNSEWKEVSGIDFAGGDHTAYQTGWKTVEIDVSEYRNKAITLSYIIYDVGDRIYDSACLIDNVFVQ